MEMKVAALSLQHVLIVVVLFTLINSVSGLSCYICNSTSDQNCQEMFNHNSLTAKTYMTDCKMEKARFCIKATGVWGGIVGSHRFCSSRDMGLQCQEVWYPDHDRKYRACVYTCDSDNCNSASTMSLTAVSVVIAAWLLHYLRV